MSPLPCTTLAVVLGASHWPLQPRFSASPSFANSAAAFLSYLEGQRGLALPQENILSLFDSDRPPSDQDSEICSFLDSRRTELRHLGSPATDLIVYYVGHGGFTRRAQDYFLAIRSTRVDSEGISSLRVADLAASFLSHAGQLRRYLILDCCFSAAANVEFMAAPLQVAVARTTAVLPPRGTALLCSSGASDASLAPAGADYTLFSGVLLSVLKHGHPDGPEWLSLADLGDFVDREIHERYPDIAVRPEVHVPDQRRGSVATIPFFPNAAKAAEVAEAVNPVAVHLEGMDHDGMNPFPVSSTIEEPAESKASSSSRPPRQLSGWHSNAVFIFATAILSGLSGAFVVFDVAAPALLAVPYIVFAPCLLFMLPERNRGMTEVAFRSAGLGLSLAPCLYVLMALSQGNFLENYPWIGDLAFGCVGAIVTSFVWRIFVPSLRLVGWRFSAACLAPGLAVPMVVVNNRGFTFYEADRLEMMALNSLVGLGLSLSSLPIIRLTTKAYRGSLP